MELLDRIFKFLFSIFSFNLIYIFTVSSSKNLTARSHIKQKINNNLKFKMFLNFYHMKFCFWPPGKWGKPNIKFLKIIKEISSADLSKYFRDSAITRTVSFHLKALPPNNKKKWENRFPSKGSKEMEEELHL